jgi:hypothetical protein
MPKSLLWKDVWHSVCIWSTPVQCLFTRNCVFRVAERDQGTCYCCSASKHVHRCSRAPNGQADSRWRTKKPYFAYSVYVAYFAYWLILRSGLPPGGRPDLRYIFFDIFHIFKKSSYKKGGCPYCLHIGHITSYQMGGVHIWHIGHIGHIMYILHIGYILHMLHIWYILHIVYILFIYSRFNCVLDARLRTFKRRGRASSAAW